MSKEALIYVMNERSIQQRRKGRLWITRKFNWLGMKKGKQGAFEALFLEEKEYLYRLAFLYMKNEDDALDLVQECILKCMPPSVV